MGGVPTAPASFATLGAAISPVGTHLMECVMTPRFGVLCLTVLSLPAAASANHIDFVQDDSNPGNGVTNATFSLSSSGAAVTQTQIGEPADILGGMRTVTVVRDGGFGQSITATKSLGTNFIEVQNDNVAAGNVILDYDGFDSLDFDTLWDRIDVQIPFIRTTGTGASVFDISLTVESSAGNGTTVPRRISSLIEGASTTVSFQFSDLALSAVDFTDVDRVTVLFDTAIISSDFQIGAITRESNAAPVPEPASIVLCGLMGVVSLAAVRKRVLA